MVLDDVPLSELHKTMILKDTSGVTQQSSKVSNSPILGKSSTARTLFISDPNVFASVLPTPPPPPPSHKTLSIKKPIILSQQQQK